MNNTTWLQIEMSKQGRQNLGVLGESLAHMELENAGYIVRDIPRGAKAGDMEVIDPSTGAIYRVEIKTARRNAAGRWKFCLYKPTHTDYQHSDIVILLAVLSSGRAVWFIIPSQQITSRCSLTISSHPERDYSGRYVQYRRNNQQIRLSH